MDEERSVPCDRSLFERRAMEGLSVEVKVEEEGTGRGGWWKEVEGEDPS